jgi:hypothetical protein
MPTIRELVCNGLLCSVCSDSANYSLLKKCRVTAANTDDDMAFFQRLLAYLRDREVVAMLDCHKLKRIGFLVPCQHTDDFGFWHHYRGTTFT